MLTQLKLQHSFILTSFCLARTLLSPPNLPLTYKQCVEFLRLSTRKRPILKSLCYSQGAESRLGWKQKPSSLQVLLTATLGKAAEGAETSVLRALLPLLPQEGTRTKYSIC